MCYAPRHLCSYPIISYCSLLIYIFLYSLAKSGFNLRDIYIYTSKCQWSLFPPLYLLPAMYHQRTRGLFSYSFPMEKFLRLMDSSLRLVNMPSCSNRSGASWLFFLWNLLILLVLNVMYWRCGEVLLYGTQKILGTLQIVSNLSDIKYHIRLDASLCKLELNYF